MSLTYLFYFFMKKNYIVGVLVLVIIVGLYTFLQGNKFFQSHLFNSYQERKKISSISKKLLIVSPSKKITHIKPGWQTYSGTQFSFDYPTSASLEKSPNNQSQSIKLMYKENDSSNKNVTISSYTLDIYSLSAKYVLYDGYAKQAQEGAYVECKWGSHISSISDTTIGNKTAKLFTIENCLGSNEYSVQYYIKNGDLITQITANLQGNQTAIAEYKKTIDQIIKTVVMH